MTAANTFQVKVQMFFSRYVTPPGLHRIVYRLSDGVIGGRLPGVRPEVLLLTLRGRRSGEPRTTPLVYFTISGNRVIAGTNNGVDRHPDWYWNAVSNPEATIQIGGVVQRVRCRLTQGDERASLWSTMTQIHPLFAAYQERTSREIPVFVLESVLSAGKTEHTATGLERGS